MRKIITLVIFSISLDIEIEDFHKLHPKDKQKIIEFLNIKEFSESEIFEIRGKLK